MRERTTVGIGGATPLLLEPRNREELAGGVTILRREGIPFRLLGGGSNILVGDEDLAEVVISLRRIARVFKPEEEEPAFRVEAGTSLARLVSTAHEYGLTGAECLIGIPGTVGGAAVMNAGGRHGAIGDLIRCATILDAKGAMIERSCGPNDFGYRTSALGKEIVIEVEVRLERGDQKEIWRSMEKILQEKKERQPLLGKSCGCIFANPSRESAGRLLERAGMKGVARGNARFSDLHANFILNRGGSTFGDYYGLIQEGRDKVEEKFGIRLDLEVETWRRMER